MDYGDTGENQEPNTNPALPSTNNTHPDREIPEKVWAAIARVLGGGAGVGPVPDFIQALRQSKNTPLPLNEWHIITRSRLGGMNSSLGRVGILARFVIVDQRGSKASAICLQMLGTTK